MRHPLNLLLRIGRSPEDAAALCGDLEEEYRDHVRPARSWLGAQGWYLKQLVVAAAHGARDGWRRPSLGAIFRPADVRFALRRWRRRPGFAVTAILTLSLGIGATTAIFSVVDAVILRPLPYPEADRLVGIYGARIDRQGTPGWDRWALSRRTWQALQQTSIFDSVGAWQDVRTMILRRDRPTAIETVRASPGFLRTLGVRLTRGRMPVANERPGAEALLTYEAWQRLFDGRPEVVGASVVVSDLPGPGRPRQFNSSIVGIIEPGFTFRNMTPDVLLPISPSSVSVRAVGRLADGVTVEQARSVIEGIVRAGETRQTIEGRLVPLADDVVGSRGQPFLLVFAGSFLLLVISCANVAGLILGDVGTRRQEIAVRRALGSSTGHVVRQFVTEQSLIAIVAAALGLVLAVWLVPGLVAIAPDRLPRLATAAVDSRVIVFAGGLGLATMLLLGTASVLATLRSRLAGALSGGDRNAAVGRHLGSRLLVAGQVALALVLVVGASLFGEAVLRLARQPLGFNPSNLVIATTQFTGRQSQMATAELVERLSALPGAESVAFATSAPWSGQGLGVSLDVSGQRPADISSLPRPTHLQIVSERYFETMDVPVLHGRSFEAPDRHGAPVTVVSEGFARTNFDGDAHGRRFSWRGGSYEVVGVVPDVRVRERTYGDGGTFYLLREPAPGTLHFLVRTSRDARSMVGEVRQTITGVSSQWVVTSAAAARDLFAVSIAEERFGAMLSGLFGTAALLLAAVGLYGLAARRVADRRRELGVRVALGAAPTNLHALVLKDAFLIVCAGLFVGLPGGYVAVRFLRSMVFELPSAGPQLFLLASGVLAGAALIAMLGPARRAARVDPVLALKD